MATYKVIQDIEAEDKFLGPLTLKQFIFGAGGIFFGYLNVFALTKGATWALAIFIPPMALGFFLAVPWSKDQPTEVWVLAKLRFKLKPKKRIWNQDGVLDLVTITAPKVEDKHLTDNLSQREVKSRLKALADTIDSRGWAVKNVGLDTNFSPPNIIAPSDRLVSPDVLPKEVPAVDLNTAYDVLDTNTPVSANFDHMIQESTEIHMQQNMDRLERIRRGEPLETIAQPPVNFTPPTVPMPQPSANISPFAAPVIVQPADLPPAQVFKPQNTALPPAISSLDEQTLSEHLKISKVAADIPIESEHKIIKRPRYTKDVVNQKTKEEGAHEQKAQPATLPAPTPAIIDLSQNNDLNVDTISRVANKEADKNGESEVVVKLH